MKVSTNRTYTKTVLEEGDMFLDSEGDLNVVLNNGQVVCFEQGTNPWLRTAKLEEVEDLDVQTILPKGSTATLTV